MPDPLITGAPNAERWRINRVVAMTLGTLLTTGCVIALFDSDWALTRFNRDSHPGSAARVTIEALIATRDASRDSATWQDDLCHPDACADFDAWATSNLDPIAETATHCLSDDDKIATRSVVTSDDPTAPRQQLWELACDDDTVRVTLRSLRTDEDAWRITHITRSE